MANRIECFGVIFAARQIEQLDQLTPIQRHLQAHSSVRWIRSAPAHAFSGDVVTPIQQSLENNSATAR
jgi:hypothetical protein